MKTEQKAQEIKNAEILLTADIPPELSHILSIKKECESAKAG